VVKTLCSQCRVQSLVRELDPMAASKSSHAKTKDPMDYTVHGILQARILEWVAFPFSRGSS